MEEIKCGMIDIIKLDNISERKRKLSGSFKDEMFW